MSREDAAIPEAVPVHFTEAIRFLRNKVRVPTSQWADLWRDQHTRGFMVAGAQRDTLIEGFQQAILKAMETGQTLESFRGDFDRIVKKEGWNYNGSRNWRSRIIFETNLRQAYNAGRWEQAQRLKARRPYMRYIAVQDERTRHHHRAWHSTILPVDHPWWNTHHPPNGWNCRCSVTTVSEREMKRRGWEVTDPPPEIVMTSRRINTGDGPKTIEVPDGIDSGFDYNPGLGAFGRGQHERVLKSDGIEPGEFFPLGYVPEDFDIKNPPVPALRIPQRAIEGHLEDPTEELMLERFRDEIGGEYAIYEDPFGHRVAITDALVRHWNGDPDKMRTRDALFGQFKELIEDPSEIWIGFRRREDGKVLLRRRYINVLRDAGKRPVVIAIADEHRGFIGSHAIDFLGTSVISGRKKASLKLGKFRRGQLIYRREE